MKKIFKIEIFKVLNYTGFWIFLPIFTIFFIATSIVVSNLGYQINILTSSNSLDFAKYLQFPHTWNTFVWIGGWFSYLWGLIIILIVGNELSNKMFRQQILWGLRRIDIFVSKLMLIFVLPIVLMLAIAVVAILNGILNTPQIDFVSIFKSSERLLFYYIQAIATMSLALFFAIWINSGMLSVVMFFAYIIFEGLLGVILNYIFKIQIAKYLPIRIFNSLTPRPSLEIAISDNLQKQLQIKDNVQTATIWIVTITFIYMLVLWFLTYWMIQKRDFK